MILNVFSQPSLKCSIVRIMAGQLATTDSEVLNNQLFSSYLRLRTEVFTKNMGWDVWIKTRSDLDGYDCQDAIYVVAYDTETFKVYGGTRLLRTSRKGAHIGLTKQSYMIYDAWKGQLKGLPSELCYEEPPVDDETWELTRLVTDGSAEVARSLLKASNDYLKSQGATKCLFLGPKAFMRMAKGMGYHPKPLGPLVGPANDTFLAFQTEVLDPFSHEATDLLAIEDFDHA